MITKPPKLRIVPVSSRSAEVRLTRGGESLRIGEVTLAEGRWCWRHRDGERSSPIMDNRAEAATALVEYHKAFKARVGAPEPRRAVPGFRRAHLA